MDSKTDLVFSTTSREKTNQTVLLCGGPGGGFGGPGGGFLGFLLSSFSIGLPLLENRQNHHQDHHKGMKCPTVFV